MLPLSHEPAALNVEKPTVSTMDQALEKIEIFIRIASSCIKNVAKWIASLGCGFRYVDQAVQTDSSESDVLVMELTHEVYALRTRFKCQIPAQDLHKY